MNSMTTFGRLSLLLTIIHLIVFPVFSFFNNSFQPQLTLTSVRVSWAGKLEQAECADNIIVKHYKVTASTHSSSSPSGMIIVIFFLVIIITFCQNNNIRDISSSV